MARKISSKYITKTKKGDPPPNGKKKFLGVKTPYEKLTETERLRQQPSRGEQIHRTAANLRTEDVIGPGHLRRTFTAKPPRTGEYTPYSGREQSRTPAKRYSGPTRGFVSVSGETVTQTAGAGKPGRRTMIEADKGERQGVKPTGQLPSDKSVRKSMKDDRKKRKVKIKRRPVGGY